LHVSLPVLAMRVRCSQDVTGCFLAAGGPWLPTAEDADPFTAFAIESGRVSTMHYRIGAQSGRQLLWLGSLPDRYGTDGRAVWLTRRDREFVCYFSIADDRDLVDVDAVHAAVERTGFDGLLAEHRSAWKARAAQSALTLPDRDLQQFYDFSQYYFQAIQNSRS